MIALRRYTSLPVLIDMLVNKRLSLVGYQTWVDVNDRYAMGLYQSSLHYGFVGAMCLTEAAETFHHWQVFAQGSAGVCIVFDKAKLEAMVPTTGHYMARSVEYLPLRKPDGLDASNIHRLPFLKRFGFRDEKEFRIIGYAVENDITAMHIQLSPQVVDRVVFSPLMPSALVASVSKLLLAIDGWSDLLIKQSRLTDNKAWQKSLLEHQKRHGTVYGPWEPFIFVDQENGNLQSDLGA